MACSNYLEIGELQTIGFSCDRTAGHKGLCGANLEAYDHSMGRRYLNKDVRIHWVSEKSKERKRRR